MKIVGATCVSLCCHVWLGLCMMSLVWGQKAGYEIEHFSIEDGLSDHRILCGLEHSDGYVWVGTHKGLNRFDGYEFQPIPLPERPAFMYGAFGPIVKHLIELSDKRILVLYGDGNFDNPSVADIYDPHTGHIEEIIPLIVDSIHYDIVLPTDTLHLMLPAYDIPIHLYHPDSLGNGMRIDRVAQSAFLETIHGDTLDLSADWFSFSLFPKPFGKDFSRMMYVVTLNGLIRFSFPSSPFERYLFDEGKAWEYKLSCRAMVQVNDSIMWVSTVQKPLAQLNLQNKTLDFPTFQDEQTGDPLNLVHIRGLHLLADSILWVVSYAGYLQKLNLHSGLGRVMEIPKQYGYYTSTQLHDGTLCLAGADPHFKHYGLIFFDPHTELYSDLPSDKYHMPVHGRSTFLLQASSGELWYATSAGLYVLDEARKVQRAYYKRNTPIDTLAPFPQFPILHGKAAITMAEAPDGKIWLGMDDGGLNALDPETHELTVYTTEEGLPNNTVCSILPHEKGFWLGTYRGLAHLDTTEDIIRTYFQENGLTHNEFNRLSFIQTTDSQYFMGGMNGVTAFRADEVLASDLPGNLMICEIQYFGQDGNPKQVPIEHIQALSQLVLPPENRQCELKVSLSNFQKAQGHTYSYCLLPSGEDPNQARWKSNGQDRTLRFDYLPAGKYDLWIRGTTSNGAVSAPERIRLNVQEFFYRTWWFISICAITLLGLGLVFFRIKLAQTRRIEQLRLKLSSDLHDDVGSLLSGVAYQMELLEYTVPEDQKLLVRKLARSSRNAISHMRDVIWAMDPRHGSVQDLVERMREFGMEMLEPVEIAFLFDLRLEEPSLTFPADKRHGTLLIFKEFITNTLKHAQATQLEVSLIQTRRTLSLRMKDNGKGLQKASELATGQGLLNMSMRAEKMGATISFLPHNGFGMQLMVSW